MQHPSINKQVDVTRQIVERCVWKIKWVPKSARVSKVIKVPTAAAVEK
jgi:hypothetical protein